MSKSAPHRAAPPSVSGRTLRYSVKRRAGSPNGANVRLHTLYLAAGLAVMLLLSYHGYWTVEVDGETVKRTLSWPWYAPVGSIIAFIWGYLLAGRKQSEPRP